MARRQWRNLSRATRDRYAREARQFGLSRRQARERYNRGTYNPGSRNAADRGPVNAPNKGVDRADLVADAIANLQRWFDDEIKFNPQRAGAALQDHASAQALNAIANASQNDIRDWAFYQRKDDAPQWIQALGYMEKDRDGHEHWHNIFWYH